MGTTTTKRRKVRRVREQKGEGTPIVRSSPEGGQAQETEGTRPEPLETWPSGTASAVEGVVNAVPWEGINDRVTTVYEDGRHVAYKHRDLETIVFVMKMHSPQAIRMQEWLFRIAGGRMEGLINRRRKR